MSIWFPELGGADPKRPPPSESLESEGCFDGCTPPQVSPLLLELFPELSADAPLMKGLLDVLAYFRNGFSAAAPFKKGLAGAAEAAAGGDDSGFEEG